MTDFLLDTNHLTESAKPFNPLLPRLHAAVARGDRFHLCPVAAAEAAFWAGEGKRRDLRPARLRAARAVMTFVPLAEADAVQSAQIRLDLRAAGHQLALPDALIAAVALRLDLTLLTRDRDFAPVPHLRTVDWLAP